jgi:hypothetical protein
VNSVQPNYLEHEDHVNSVQPNYLEHEDHVNSVKPNYLEHDDHMALVEDVARRVHCDPREMLYLLGIPEKSLVYKFYSEYQKKIQYFLRELSKRIEEQ